MSMMMPPQAPPGLPIPPGGAGTPPPPMDALAGAPMPAEGGLEGLVAALQGGGMPTELGGNGMPPGLGGPPGMGGPDGGGILESEGEEEEPMSSIEHIQQAMKHLMMAMAGEDDEERGLGLTKGMGALQGILAGEQKKQSQLGALGG